MKRIFISFLLICIGAGCFAQKSLRNYTLRVGATDSVGILDSFPTSYASEKVNISLHNGGYVVWDEHCPLDSFDIILTHTSYAAITAWGDSIYSYIDESNVCWTVWCNHRKISSKNKQKSAGAKIAYNAFTEYVRTKTSTPSRLWSWIGWSLAGFVFIASLIYGILYIRRRRAEKLLSPVEQETLHRRRMGERRHVGSQLYLWLILLVLYAPIALIAIYSFTESKIMGNWTGFSLDLYANLFTGKAGESVNNAIFYTVVIALIAAVCSTILGTLAAIGIYNMRSKQRKMVSFLNSVPMINPDIITGISLFLLFVALGVSQGLTTVCIAHIVFCTPYVVLSVLPRLSRMNPNIYEAALDLGATPMQALRKVMIPELWPGMLSGFVLALTLSVDDFGVTFFTKGSGGLDTLSTFIYSDARKGGLTPELRPLFTIILLVVLAVLIFINIRDRKRYEKAN